MFEDLEAQKSVWRKTLANPLYFNEALRLKSVVWVEASSGSSRIQVMDLRKEPDSILSAQEVESPVSHMIESVQAVAEWKEANFGYY